MLVGKKYKRMINVTEIYRPTQYLINGQVIAGWTGRFCPKCPMRPGMGWVGQWDTQYNNDSNRMILS